MDKPLLSPFWRKSPKATVHFTTVHHLEQVAVIFGYILLQSRCADEYIATNGVEDLCFRWDNLLKEYVLRDIHPADYPKPIQSAE